MTGEPSKSSGSTLWRGGRKLELTKAPDRFTARVRPGVRPEEIAPAHTAVHQGRAERQNLEVFAVSPEARDAAMDTVRSSPDVEFASHVYQIQGDPGASLYLTDEITVQFRPEVSEDAIEALVDGVGLALLKEVPGLARTYVFRVTERATENPLKIADRLLADPRVLSAEPNIVTPAQRFFTPTDTHFAEQWHLDHHGGLYLAPGSHIDAARAWDITRGERTVVVAIADDSCDLSHPDLQGPGKIVAARDFAGRDFSPLPDRPTDNHGTACAAVAVAESNGQGVVGVAPGCALMPIRTSGMLDDSSVEDLFAWAVSHGADVISCSWGPVAREFPLSLRMQNALHRAATLGRGGRGCVILFAAGNANRPIDGVVDEHGWPGNIPSGPTSWFNGFAAHPDVIAVAACTSLARKAAYSSWGREISICAPSNNAEPQIHSGPTYPLVRGSLPGLGIVTADRVGLAGYSFEDYTFSFGGTSSACPTAAGVAALVLSANPDLTAREVRAILEATADKIVDLNPDPQLGNAFGDYAANGHSPWFGHGKVNAFQAVSEAVRRKVDRSPRTVLRQLSAPSLDIPDNDEVGVHDTVRFAEEGGLIAVAVQVDIDHPSVGDLRLTLTSPSGTTVRLHDRNGGPSEHLKRSFDASTTPGLSALVGQQLSGSWKLHVQDLAAGDIGRWNSWSITAAAQADARPDKATLSLAEAPGAPIPDNRPEGIARSLQADAAGRILDVAVSVDITHTYIGDLSVTLVSPAGTRVDLHQRAGGSADNLITTYTPATTPGLQHLRGEMAQGSWTLIVRDLEAEDVGKLNRWSVRLTYAPAAAGSMAAGSPNAPSTARAGEADDLKLIKGVGPAVESRLIQAGIQTFSQLAANTPEALAALTGLSLERIRREEWITQAKVRAAHEAAAGRPAAGVGDGPSSSALTSKSALEIATPSQHYETFTLHLTLDADGRVQRTRVVHVQDGAEQTWAGWQSPRLIDFVVDQAALGQQPAEQEPEPRPTAHQPGLAQPAEEQASPLLSPGAPPLVREQPLPAAASAPPGRHAEEQASWARERPWELEEVPMHSALQLEVTEVTLSRPGETDALPNEEPRLYAGVTFQLIGPPDDLLRLHDSPYLLQVFAYEIEAGHQSLLAAERQQLFVQGQPAPTPERPWHSLVTCSGSIDFHLPDPGRYELQAMVSLPDAGVSELRPGPVFTITP